MEGNNVQKVRFNDETIEIETVIIRGIEYLRLEDVQQPFPSVTALFIGNRKLAFVTDENGHNSEPLRFKAYLNEVIDGRASKTSSDVVSHDQFDRMEGKIDGLQITADRIDANTQKILKELTNMMRLVYEIQEYTTPRYFFILPARHHNWTILNTVENWFHLHYKLYFLCECSDDPKELHIAPHDGYSIKKLRQFITRYGPYLLTTIRIVQISLTIGGFVFPQLGNVSTAIGNVLPSCLQISDDFVQMKEKVDLIYNFLEKPETKLMYADSSLIQKQNRSQSAALQGADLRELESYLERIDCTRALGNLYRSVTDDGYVRWVCQEHYDKIKYQNSILVYIKQFEAMGGEFNLKTKEAILNRLKFTDTNVQMISEALTKGFNISNLILHQCSISETRFDKLIDIIINRSSIHSLELINLDILGFFDKLKYHAETIKITLSNYLIVISFDESYQDGNNNLLIRILMQNKIHRTLQISTCDFSHNEQQLKQCLDTNTIIPELIVDYANNIDILNPIFQTKVNKLQRLKLNYSLRLPSVANHFCQLLKTNQTLVELDLIDSIGFSDEDFLENLFQIFRQHKSIKQLRLHISSIQNSDRKETLLINVLQNYKFLSHLRLSRSFISSELIQTLVYTIEEHRSLVHLEFYLCQLNQNDIEQLKTLENDGLLFHLIISEQSRPVSVSINGQQTFHHSQLKSNLKWESNAMTIAGGNGEGDKSNQLNCPYGIYVDDQQQTIYIADYENHRIVRWKLGENNGQIVAGGNGRGYRIDQLNHPTDVIVDQNNKSVIICDYGNSRVVRWSLENQQDKQILIKNIGCYGLKMNENGDLFVSDFGKHEVRRWIKGDKEGAIVAGGNGCGDKLHQLENPTFLFIDRQETVYVSDFENHRVMKWMKDAKEGIAVTDRQGRVNKFKHFCYPQGLIVDEVGDVYVADTWNRRIMCWSSRSNEGHVVGGRNGYGSNQLNDPKGFSFDVENNLYVVDSFNHRIQRFSVDKN